jgi:hypothetical protein
MDVEVTTSTEFELDIAALDGKVAGHSTRRRVLVIA